ncbi:site-specific integrase [Shewanella baltica]|uniref:site-specific integrase n=1 Tax=Shewanella baltica TaxID=62322 RepID=UPI003D7B51A4
MAYVKQVETTTIDNYIYRKPIISIDIDGEPVKEYRRSDKGILVKKMIFLNIVTYDENDKLVSFEAIEQANKFLLSKAIDDGVLDVASISRGLLHYFSFLLDLQLAWDNDFDEDTFDEFYDEPRPEWDRFPRSKRDRQTYLYRDGLKQLVIDGEVAKTTAKNYIGSVVNFYKYWMRRGYQFNNPPFEHEVVTLLLDTNASSMKPHQKKDIHTTDLRLKFTRSSRSGGTALENLRRDLKPFTPREWTALQNVLMKSRRVLRHGDETKLHSLPVEYTQHFMICRYTGLRREEAASLHRGQIVNPEVVINDSGQEVFKKPILNLGIGDKYKSFTKTPERGNKSRVTIIPAGAMKSLYDYMQSERYQKRLIKFRSWCASEIEKGNTHLFKGDDAINPNLDYLFLTQTGKPMFLRLGDFTNKWVEVRNTVNHSLVLEHKIAGSIHNLRATFAVDLFRHMLKAKDDEGRLKFTPDIALDRVSALLGHEDRSTTMDYLKIAQDMPMGDEIYEDVLDYIGVFDDIEA